MSNKLKKKNKNELFNYWLNRLTEITLNIFKWDNLPEEINQLAMQKSIMLDGFAIFFKDKGLDRYYALPGAISGVDVYGYPSVARPISKNASITFDSYDIDKDCVVIYANKTRTSANMQIVEFANRLVDVDMAIQLNTKAMKHPILFKTSEQKKETFESLLRQYEDNWYIISADKQLDIENSLDTVNLEVSALEILNLMKEKESILNEFYNIFGVTSTVEKRERVVSGEINVQLQQTAVNTNIWLSCQKEACDKINRMFGLNVDVSRIEYSDTSDEIEDENKADDSKDGDINE